MSRPTHRAQRGRGREELGRDAVSIRTGVDRTRKTHHRCSQGQARSFHPLAVNNFPRMPTTHIHGRRRPGLGRRTASLHIDTCVRSGCIYGRGRQLLQGWSNDVIRTPRFWRASAIPPSARDRQVGTSGLPTPSDATPRPLSEVICQRLLRRASWRIAPTLRAAAAAAASVAAVWGIRQVPQSAPRTSAVDGLRGTRAVEAE